MKRYLLVTAIVTSLFLLLSPARAQQTVTSGSPTLPINFGGTGCTYYWKNDNPNIGLAPNGKGNIASFTADNTGSSPITATITAQPLRYIYTADAGESNTSQINSNTGLIQSTISIGAYPDGIAIDPVRKILYTAAANSNALAINDMNTNNRITDIGIGKGPGAMVLSPDGSVLYVTNQVARTLVAMTTTNYQSTTLALGATPGGIALSPDGSTIYITNNNINTVSVIDVASFAITATVNVGLSPSGIAVSPDGKSVYVVNNDSGNVIVIDAASNTVKHTIPIVLGADGNVLVTPDGKEIFVNNATYGQVNVINTSTYAVTATITVGNGCFSSTITPDGSTVYVANQYSNTVSVIDVATNSVTATLNTGANPSAIAVYTGGSGCTPGKFTITVNPPATGPAISATLAAGNISACAGTASAEPFIQQFFVSGTNLTGDITATAPAGFEISLANASGFGKSIPFTPTAGKVSSTVVYMRSAATAPAGKITGKVQLTSPGATPITVAVNGVVNALPTVNTVSSQNIPSGSPTTAINFTGTADSYTWTNDNPGIGLAASGTGNIASFTAINPGSATLTATVTVTPIAPPPLAYVANEGSNSISVINTLTDKISATINVPQSPANVTLSPDNTRLYVSNYINNSITVINAATQKVITTFPLGFGPHGLVVSPDGSKLYVADTGDDNIVVVNTATNGIIANYATGHAPFGVALSGDGTRLYVANQIGNTVTVINTTTNVELGDIPVGLNPYNVAVSVDGSRVYVTNYFSNTVSVIDAASLSVIKIIPVGTNPNGIALSPDGSTVYVANAASNNVSVISTAVNAVTATFNVGAFPNGLAVSSDGSQLFVINAHDNTVSVVNTANNKLVTSVGTGSVPVAFGNFVTSGVNCDGVQMHFTISVLPSDQPPSITASAATGFIIGCEGTASLSPNIQRTTISAHNLTADVTATAPPGFEVSMAQGNGYANSIDIPQSGGLVSSVVMYIRSTAGTPAGNISGSVVLSSAGAQSVNLGVSGVVNAIPGVNPVGNQTIPVGTQTTAVNFTGAANTFTWVNDTPGIGLSSTGTGNIAPFTGLNTGTTPLTATITVTPTNVSYAYIANNQSNTVSVIDLSANQPVATITVGKEPTGVAISPDGSKAYVTNLFDNTVSVINTQLNTVTATIHVQNFPYGIAVSPDGSKVYVANNNSNSMSVIDAATNTVKATVTVGSVPRGLAVSPDGSHIYVANGNSSSVSIIDAATYAVTNVTIGQSPLGVAVSPDGSTVYVVNQYASLGATNASISVISTSTNSVSNVILLPIGVVNVALNGDGSLLYASNDFASNISVINTSTLAVINTITFPANADPFGLQLSEDGTQLYAANQGSKSMSVIDAATGTITATIAAGIGPYSIGKFVNNGSACRGNTTQFTITVQPPATSVISATIATGTISACSGTASASPFIQQFQVSGSNLTGFTATATAGFEVSLNAASGYGSSVTFANVPNNTPVFVRSAATAQPGNISGKITLSASGASSVSVAVNGIINALPSVTGPIPPQTLVNGATTTAVNFSGTANTFSWVNNTPSIGLAASGTGNIAPFIAVNTGTSAVMATVTVTPETAPLAYIADTKANAVAVVNLITNTIITTIPVGASPEGVAVSRDGTRVYVANYNDGTVSVINALNNSVSATINVGSTPLGIVVSADGKTVYVANYGSNSISVINTSGNAVTATIGVGSGPQGLVLSPDGASLYVANYFDKNVQVISTTSRAIKATIAINTYVFGITVTPDGNYLYVADQTTNAVSVISTATNQVVKTVTVGGVPIGVSVSPDGSIVYVVNQGSGTISVISTATNQVVTTINVGSLPVYATFNADGSRAYVANIGSDNITVIETAANSVVNTIPGGSGAGSFGNFITPGVDCSGTPTQFTITVKPSATPGITVSAVTGVISACQGTASADPFIQQFTVSGTNLPANVPIQAPPGFELAFLPGGPYFNNGGIVIQPGNNNINNEKIYVRSAASAPVGKISGTIVLSSNGNYTQNVQVNGVINPVAAADPIADQQVNNGTLTQAVKFTGSGNTFTWTNDMPSIGLPASGTGDITPFIAINKSSTDVTATVTVTPTATGFAFIPNKTDNTVSVINTSTNVVEKTIKVGQTPTGVAVSPDGSTVYISNQSDNSISVIDTKTMANIATVVIGQFTPTGIAVSPDGKSLYVVNLGSNNVSVLNTTTYAVTKTFPVGGYPIGVTVSNDNNTVYVTNSSDYISVIDLTTSVVKQIPVDKGPYCLALSPDGSKLYVANSGTYMLSVIDVASNSVKTKIKVGVNPVGVAVSPDGSTVYVTNQFGNSVSVINTGSGTVSATIPVNATPTGVSVSGDGRYVYVANQGANNVSVINTSTNKTIATVNVGVAPEALGQFVTGGSDCSGAPVTFKIIVKATATQPAVTASVVAGNVGACVGSASPGPQTEQFTVSGNNLTGDITITSPTTFYEISTDPNTGFASALTIKQTAGIVNNTIVYVESTAAAPAGDLTGNLIITSPGTQAQNVQVSATVSALPTVNVIGPQIYNNGDNTMAIDFTNPGNTGVSYSWTNNTPSIGLAASGTGNIASFKATNTTANPVTAQVKVSPQASGFAYVPASGSGNVTAINTSNNAVVKTIAVGSDPFAAAVSPDGTRVYVSNTGSGTISVISTSTNTVVETIKVDANPQTIAISPDGNNLYVVYGEDGAYYSVVNTATGAVTDVPSANWNYGIAVSPDSKTLYIANSVANTLSVINTATNAVIAAIPAGQGTYGVVVSPDGKYVYTANSNSNDVSVIDTKSNSVSATIQVGQSPGGICISADGSTIFVANTSSNSVSEIYTYSNKVVGTIAGFASPLGVSISPDQKQLYVANYATNNVTVVNTATDAILQTVGVGINPQSVGSFVSGPVGCSGAPVTFNITVNPAATSLISVTGNLASLSTIYGIPSTSATFTVSGASLQTGILVTPPAGFEVSQDDINFAPTVTLGTTGTLTGAVVYIRLASTTHVGSYSGNIVMSTAGSADVPLDMPTSTVTPAPLTITADNKTRTYNTPNPTLTATYSGFVNKDTQAQLTTKPTVTTTATITSPIGQYQINASGAVTADYNITYIAGVLTVESAPPPIMIPNTFTPNGDGINDVWNIKYLQYYPNCTVNIYNRFGEKLYSSVGYSIPWDGRYKGANLPVGTYYYIIDLKSNEAVLSGYVAIIR